MNNTLQTDYLCSSDSFLTGTANVFNLGGYDYDYNYSTSPSEADTIAIRSDFENIGNDIRKVLAKYK